MNTLRIYFLHLLREYCHGCVQNFVCYSLVCTAFQQKYIRTTDDYRRFSSICEV
jgi:hypothetical protein